MTPECGDCEFVETDDSGSCSCDSECSSCCSCDEECQYDAAERDEKAAAELKEQLAEVKNFFSNLTQAIQQQNFATAVTPTVQLKRPQYPEDLNDELNEIEDMLARQEINFGNHSNAPPTPGMNHESTIIASDTMGYSTPTSTATTLKSGFSYEFDHFSQDFDERNLAALHQALVSLDLFTYMYIVEQVLDEATRRELTQVGSPCTSPRGLGVTCLDVQEHL